MSGHVYVAGDFSGIQRYVLGITSAGGGQARRLRARSFTVQVLSEIVVGLIREAVGNAEELVNGGGQFLLRVEALPGVSDTLQGVCGRIESALFEEFSGELGLTVAWADSVPGALQSKERAKRRPWSEMLIGDGWHLDRFSMPVIGEICELCRSRQAATGRRDYGAAVRLCDRCDRDIRIGQHLQRRSRMVIGGANAQFHLLGSGFDFEDPTADSEADDIERHIPVEHGQLLTFEELSSRARGAKLLGVLKADVDSMGVHVARMIEADPTYGELTLFSKRLDRFFGREVQGLMKNGPFRLMYTVYSGGDDLLLIGPWDLVPKFALKIQAEFTARFPGLTLSAGIACAQPHVPVREVVERAEGLLHLAKRGTKNQCAALEGVFRWEKLAAIVEEGEKCAGWIGNGVAPRSLLHRLYRIASEERWSKAGLWAYQVGRNISNRRPEAQEFRRWGLGTLRELRARERSPVASSLLYALMATRQ